MTNKQIGYICTSKYMYNYANGSILLTVKDLILFSVKIFIIFLLLG